MAKLLVLHGPNLNRLGARQPDIYGATSLEAINQGLATLAQQSGNSLQYFQTNSEGALCDAIHQAAETDVDFILINPAAYGHTSIALRDALLSVPIPFIEVHLSNTAARESFRHTSLLSDIAVGVIQGFGAKSYELALHAAIHHLTHAEEVCHGHA